MKNHFKRASHKNRASLNAVATTPAGAPTNSPRGGGAVAADVPRSSGSPSEPDWERLLAEHCRSPGRLDAEEFVNLWSAALRKKQSSVDAGEETKMPNREDLLFTFAVAFGTPPAVSTREFLDVVGGLWKHRDEEPQTLARRLRALSPHALDHMVPPQTGPLTKVARLALFEELQGENGGIHVPPSPTRDALETAGGKLSKVFGSIAMRLRGPQEGMPITDVRTAIVASLEAASVENDKDEPLDKDTIIKSFTAVWRRPKSMPLLVKILANVTAATTWTPQEEVILADELPADELSPPLSSAGAGFFGRAPQQTAPLPTATIAAQAPQSSSTATKGVHHSDGPRVAWEGTALWAETLDDDDDGGDVVAAASVVSPSAALTFAVQAASHRLQPRVGGVNLISSTIATAREPKLPAGLPAVLPVGSDDFTVRNAAVSASVKAGKSKLRPLNLCDVKTVDADSRRLLRLLEGPSGDWAPAGWESTGPLRPPSDEELEALLPYQRLLGIADDPSLSWIAAELRDTPLPHDMILMKPSDVELLAREAFLRYPPPVPSLLFARPAPPAGTDRDFPSELVVDDFEIERRHPVQAAFDHIVALTLLVGRSAIPHILIDAAEERWVSQYGISVNAWRSDGQGGFVNSTTGRTSVEDPRDRLLREVRVGCRLIARLRKRLGLGAWEDRPQPSPR
eukprot:TRINITY_DN54898_c0_g1_i1.p1 TRINITY_DN54898_c0_g1~~TRINITY_DN54898_c0_g1_i1.p1  ORF type:complete len:684 (+),score=106.33 TRINITY_DN54898_c0_g1_i1:134-2185(+)